MKVTKDSVNPIGMGLTAVAILGKTISTNPNTWRVGGTAGMINVGLYEGGQWKRIFDVDCILQTSDPDYPATATIYECTDFEHVDTISITKAGTQFHKVTHHNPTTFDKLFEDMIGSNELKADANIAHVFTKCSMSVVCSSLTANSAATTFNT